MRRAIFVIFALTACAGPRAAGDGAAPQSDVQAVATAYWEAILRRDPTEATFIGDRRHDAVLPDRSESAELAWHNEVGELRQRLLALPLGEASPEDQLTARVMAVQLESTMRGFVCRRELWNVDQLSGYHLSLTELSSYQGLGDAQAAADYVSRIAHLPSLFDQHIDNLERGLGLGYSAPRHVVTRVLEQLDGLIKTPDAASPFVLAADRAALGEPERARLRQDLVALVRTAVRPAWQRYREFLSATYLPKAREVVGVGHNRDGAACYAALVSMYTGAASTAQEIHAAGKKELERLRAEMEGIAKAQGHATLAAYTTALRSAAPQYLGSREALLAHNQKLVERATAALPRAFGKLPPWGVGVKAIETFRENEAPAAYYYSAADDGSRPAYYYVNTAKPETRPLFNMEALAFHEAVPGHHLQIAIAQGLEGLPKIRRHSGFTAFVEGWALYAELLADELGLYSSPDARLGMLNYPAWRATRLVVDTGLHALGWSRQQAIDFMKANLVLPDDEIVNEVDRYITWPGQALAYMLGRMEIQRLRKLAEQRLGPRFDLKAFHDRLLGNGPLPLEILAEVMTAWIDEQASAAVATR